MTDRMGWEKNRLIPCDVIALYPWDLGIRISTRRQDEISWINCREVTWKHGIA